MAGRPVGPGGRKFTTSFGISKSKQFLIEELDEIAKRESASRSEIIVRALEEYIELHGPGNNQTILESFGEDGRRSRGQVEEEI